MKNRTSILSILGLFATIPLLSQKPAYIDQMEMYIKQDTLILNYEILDGEAGDSYQIDLIFYDDHYNYLKPVTLSGDYGPAVLSGSTKQLKWAYLQDAAKIKGDFKPHLFINREISLKGNKGSILALASIFVPGLGDYFVYDTRKMGFKPWMRTIGAYAFVGLGIAALKNKSRGPDFVFWRENPNEPGALEKYTKPGKEQPWLFQYDAELFFTVGVAFWLYDVIWVWSKGLQNDKLRISGFYKHLQHTNVSLRHETFQLSYTYTF